MLRAVSLLSHCVSARVTVGLGAPPVYPPCTRADDAPDAEPAMSAAACSEGGARQGDVDRAEGIEKAFQLHHPRCRPARRNSWCLSPKAP